MTLVVVLVIVGVLIGCQNTSSTRSDSSKQADTSSQSAQSSSPAKEPAPINLSGNGQTATDTFNLDSGLAIFRMTHQGQHNFIVHLVDKNGKDVGGSLANDIGPFNGSKAIQVPRDDIYLLNVQADGSWTIQVT
jgi:hypothetical protein